MRRRRATRSLEDRFWEKVDKTGTCWEWTAARMSNGYGVIGKGRRQGMILAHRASFEMAHGPIPTTLTIDHLCRNRACVNPAHLEAVTMRENVLRGMSPWAVNARKTHCIHGHAFTAENTRVDKRCRRCCRACDAARHRRSAAA